MPKARMLFDPKKKYIKAAKEWDEADLASGEIKIAKRSAVDAGITFIDGSIVETYLCKCGVAISSIDFMLRWLRNIRNKQHEN